MGPTAAASRRCCASMDSLSADRGELSIADQTVAALSRKALARHTAFVPQDTVMDMPSGWGTSRPWVATCTWEGSSRKPSRTRRGSAVLHY